MRLYLLKPNSRPNNDPWWRKLDVANGFVVCAQSALTARRLAAEEAGGEGSTAWLNPDLSDCVELHAAGQREYVVMRDFHAG